MKAEKIIYVDREFIGMKYEDEFSEPVPTSFIKDEGMQASIKFLVASGGAHTKEVTHFNYSSYGMLKKLKQNLNYDIFDVFENISANTIAWLEGELFIAHHKLKKIKGNKTDETSYGYAFEIRNSKSQNNIMLSVKKEYFISGYDVLLDMIEPIYMSFKSTVKCLAIVLNYNEVIQRYVAIPYVIELV